MAVLYKKGKTQQLLSTSDGVPRLSLSDTEGLEDSWFMLEGQGSWAPINQGNNTSRGSNMAETLGSRMEELTKETEK